MTFFKDLDIGDMFNTKAARYVKTGEDEAIVVMSGIFDIGQIKEHYSECNVIVLYSKKSALQT